MTQEIEFNLIRKISWSFHYTTGVDYDELYAEASLAYCEAMNDWSPERGTKPAGKYLVKNGIKPWDFNSYGSRRGNHEVMMRGTFANIRIKNQLVSDAGGLTVKFPENEQSYVFDAARKYQADQTDLIVFGGREYGTGSSRDWAAKGTILLGIRAVIATSFERIHRSNLVGMGVLPLIFQKNDSFESLGLKATEAKQPSN